MSRIFRTLGADKDVIPLLWIAAPLNGLLVQTLIIRINIWLASNLPWMMTHLGVPDTAIDGVENHLGTFGLISMVYALALALVANKINRRLVQYSI